MTARIFLKLIGAFLSLLIIAMAAVDFLSADVAERNYIQSLTQELTNYGRLLTLRLDDPARPMTQADAASIGAAVNARVTVIGSDGFVVVDSEAAAGTMENHRDRPEVAQALAGQVGSSTRPSPTVGIRYHYVALPIPEGALRFAVPLSAVQQRVSLLRMQILTAAGLSFLPAILLAGIFARSVSTKLGKIIDFSTELARGHFGARLAKLGKDELGILGKKLNETGENLERMFNELQREHAELAKLETVRKDFVINVSHELRTPLAAIQGYTETLLDGALEDPQHNRRFLGIIKQNTERLTSLSADLLTLSRLEMKRQEFQFASFRAKALLEDTIDTLTPLAARRGIQLVLSRIDASQEVFCDREAFYQILSNLVDNAVKYSSENSTIRITAEAITRENRPFVEFSVRDNGLGIPTEDLPRIFERFYRVDKARSRELGGTGLGLSIVKHLVLAQAGMVRVESTLGESSTFYFSLPAEEIPFDQTVPPEGNATVIIPSSH
jgi:two-component system phosphate regulon sensor histidine kinase PhoR